MTTPFSFDKTYFKQHYGDDLNEAFLSGVNWYQGLLSYISKHLNLTLNVDKKMALDVGCGLGSAIKVLTSMGFYVEGVDISEYAINMARQLLGQYKVITKLRVVNIEQGVPTHKYYDLVTMFEVLEHLRRPTTALRNIYNVLAYDGSLIASTPNPESYLCFIPLYSKTIMVRYDVDPTHINVRPASYWKKLLKECGFRDINTLFVHYDYLYYKFLKRIVFHRVPRHLAHTLVLVAVK